MPHEQRTFFILRQHGTRRAAALFAAAILSLLMVGASASASSVLTSVAGGGGAGVAGFGGDGGPATAAQLATPSGVAVDGKGNVVVADTANQRIRRIDAATGTIATVAGGAADGAPGFGGDGGQATAARLNGPAGVAIDASANVVIADTANNRIRRIDAASGVITTVAGGAANGAPGFGGDGGAATRAQLNSPSGVAVDGSGGILIADSANNRIRRIDAATGIIATVAGGAANGAPGFGGDGGPPVSAQLNGPAGVAVDGTGNVSIADTANNRVRRIDAATATIATLAGPTGDSAPPLGHLTATQSVPALGPLGVAVDHSGATFVANSPRNRIDKLVAGTDTAAPDDGVTTSPAQPTDPSSLCQLVEGEGTATSTSPSWMTRTVSVTTPTAEPGQQLGVEGSGFASGQQLTVTLCSVPTVLGSVTADPLGSYRTSVKIPADVAPGAHHLVLSDPSGTAAVALRVQAARGGGTGVGGGTGDPVANDPAVDPLANDPSLNNPSLNDPSTSDPLGDGSVSIDNPGTVGADGTDPSGMPTTGGEFLPLLLLGGASLKLGGLMVLAGRKRLPTR
ncbi:MAG: hypothetical protein M3011_02215 [Actinomycetota bacterium]|nr:hypothetical protein [Actinomycetota bacterium]